MCIRDRRRLARALDEAPEQPCGRAEEQPVSAQRFALRLPGHGPVSYTHLDVYKRQAASCLSLSVDTQLTLAKKKVLLSLKPGSTVMSQSKSHWSAKV